MLGDRRVDDTPGAEFVEQPLRHLVSALVFGDLLAHHKNIAVAAHLFGHRVAECLAHGLLNHFGAFRHLRRVERRRGFWKGIKDRDGFAAGLRFLRAIARLGFWRFGRWGFGLGGFRLYRLRYAGGLLRLRSRGGFGRRGGCRRVLALSQNHSDRRVDLHALRALTD